MKEIKIFNFPWHLSHQYELTKIPGTKWTWLEQSRRPYSKGVRGDFAKDIERVPFYEKGKYDVALLHLDQQCFERGIWKHGKGLLYKDLNKVITDIPKIVVMHGTPYYPEKFANDITGENYKELGFTESQIGMSSELINMCKEVVGDNLMVTNSETAAKQWGFGHTIIHGLDADEWEDKTKEPRVVTMISPGGLDDYYDRELLTTVKELLMEIDIYLCHITRDTVFRNWEDYKNFLGRSLIYFNPTRESPMPRARTEAMFSGCCLVSTANQDAERFLVNGENSIVIKRDNPQFIVDIIVGLIKNYRSAIKIGQEGRKTAMELFSGDRYRQDWRKLLEGVV